MRAVSPGPIVSLFLIASLTLVSCKVSFVPLTEQETRYDLTTTGQLQDPEYAQRIGDFYDSGNEGTFKGRAGVPIYYKIFRKEGKEKGAILISSGRSEAALKYKEVIFDLYHNGYSIYIHDHRGQGLSGRMTEDPELGYIDTFQFYIDDMKYFFDRYLKPGDHERAYLLAHSMGGAIGMTYLEQFPDDFDAAAFISPMLGLKPPLCLLAGILAGEEPEYAPGQTGYSDDSTHFEGNTVTGSKVRYHRKIAAYARVPEARLGGASTLWVHRSCRQFRYIFDHIENIETPFILFTAEDEDLVDPRSHRKFIREALQEGKQCRAFLVENARHELLMEKDPLRTRVISTVMNFYDQYSMKHRN